MTEEELKAEIKQLESNNKILEEQLEQTTNNYKKLSLELGQIIFQNEDYEYEITKLKNKIKTLEEENKQINEENEKLKEFKKEVEKSTAWKVKTIFK